MTTLPAPVSARQKAGVKRMRKHNLKTDMTPMVDLGFLLISFFIFTAELSRPRVTNLVMPKEGNPTTLSRLNALTLLIADESKAFYYEGEWENGKPMPTSFSVQTGIGHIIREKQIQLDKTTEGREGLMLLIKPGPGASYKNVIDALDEAMINQVKRYAIVKPEVYESVYMQTSK